MKRFLFLIITSIPSAVLCAWVFGPITPAKVLVIWVAIFTGYVWGITAPPHMHKIEIR